jgi:sulfur-carrier protein
MKAVAPSRGAAYERRGIRVRVRFAGTLRQLTGGTKELAVPVGSLRTVIDAIDSTFQGFRAKVLGSDGDLKKSIVVYVNGREVRHLAGMETRIVETDDVLITIPLAGG